MKKFFRNNGLSVVFLMLFVISLSGQIVTGFKLYNQQIVTQGAVPVSLKGYFSSGHFLQSTFENWESEFLQMALYLILSMALYQKGSSESKDPDAKNEVDRGPDPGRKNAPWPVKKGGWILAIYRHSLCYLFSLIFIVSFLVHWYGSMKDFNEGQNLKHLPLATAFEYLGNNRLWFESFQNWQSEFLSIFAIVWFSVYLREQGSPQSKPVDAPNSETGG